jgi:hypothetical protein
MIKHLSKISGVAAFAAFAASASAEVAINENLSLDGYATAAAVVTEGGNPSASKDKVLFDSGRVYDSALVAVNGKYEAFTAKASIYTVKSSKNGTTADSGLLDAYVTYKTGDFSVTGGKFLGWLGYESFHSVNNAFISYSMANYVSPFSTGVKTEYTTKDYSTGVSVRDSNSGALPAKNFFDGDGEFSDDLGYEAYFLYSGIEKVTVFAGAAYDDKADEAGQMATFDLWVSYALTDKLTLAAEYASVKDTTSFSWLTQATYAVSDALSVSARLTAQDNDAGTSNGFGYGVASTYTLSKNFALKGEVTMAEAAADTFSYAVQGIFKF